MSKLKKILALALGASISITTALSFVGCKVDTKDPVKPGPGIENPDTPIKPDPGDDKPIIVPPVENPDDKEEEAKKEFAAAVKTANDKLAAIETGMNFKYSVVFEDTSKLIAEFDKQNVKLQKDGTTLYYTKDGRVNYEFSLEDGKWQKNITDVDMQGDFAEFVISINRISWTDYDKTKNQLHGTRMGDDVVLVVGQSKIDMIVNFDPKTGKYESEITLSNFGTTKVTLPELEATKPPVATGNIYEIVNGEKVFNLVAIRDVLEPWLKGDNQFGKDFFAARRLSDKYKTRNIVYIKASQQDLAFGTIYDYDTTKVKFGESHFENKALYNGIADGSILTKEDFKNYLMSIAKNDVMATVPDFDVEYATNDVNYEQTHKTEFEAMTKNIFAKLDIDGLDEKNVKFAFKNPQGRVTESAQNGWLYRTNWKQFYIVEIEDELCFLEVDTSASTSFGVEYAAQHVANNSDYWRINEGQTNLTKLQDGNKALYQIVDKELTL